MGLRARFSRKHIIRRSRGRVGCTKTVGAMGPQLNRNIRCRLVEHIDEVLDALKGDTLYRSRNAHGSDNLMIAVENGDSNTANSKLVFFVVQGVALLPNPSQFLLQSSHTDNGVVVVPGKTLCTDDLLEFFVRQ